jgi:hypothetical protein
MLGHAPMASSTRFPIKFDALYARLSRGLFISPSDSYVEIEGGRVSVTMSWAFRATFDRSRVTGISLPRKRTLLTRGVHGWAGRWLVNGAGDGIVEIDLEPGQRAFVTGFPVSLRKLQVSVEDPAALAAALTASDAQPAPARGNP